MEKLEVVAGAVAEAPTGVQGGVTNMGKLEVIAAAVALKDLMELLPPEKASMNL